MKLTKSQKKALQKLQVALDLLFAEMLEDDQSSGEFGNMIASKYWFSKSVDEISAEIAELLEQ